MGLPNFSEASRRIARVWACHIRSLHGIVRGLRITCACAHASHFEALPEIKLTANGIVDEKIFCAFTLHPAVVNQIGAVHD